MKLPIIFLALTAAIIHAAPIELNTATELQKSNIRAALGLTTSTTGGVSVVPVTNASGNLVLAPYAQGSAHGAGPGNILLPDLQYLGWMNPSTGLLESGIYANSAHSGGAEMLLDAKRICFYWQDGMQIGSPVTNRDGRYIYLSPGSSTVDDQIRESPPVAFNSCYWDGAQAVGQSVWIQNVPTSSAASSENLQVNIGGTVDSNHRITGGVIPFKLKRTGLDLPLQTVTASTNALNLAMLASPSYVFLRDEFSNIGITATGDQGDLSWRRDGASGTTAQGSDADGGSRVGVLSQPTGAVSGNYAALYLGNNPAFYNLMSTRWYCCYIVKVDSTANVKCEFGFMNSGGSYNDWGGTAHFGLRYFGGTDTNWMWCNGASTTDTTVSASTNWIKVEMKCESDGVVQGSLNGGAWQQFGTGMTTTTDYSAVMSIRTTTAAAKTFSVDFFSYYATGTGR